MEQPVVLHRALHRLHQQVVGGGPGSVGLAFRLSTVRKAGEEEEEVVDIPQELLTFTGEFEGRLVFKDAGGETEEAGEPVVLDGPVLLVQDLTAGRRQTFSCWRTSELLVRLTWQNNGVRVKAQPHQLVKYKRMTTHCVQVCDAFTMRLTS